LLPLLIESILAQDDLSVNSPEAKSYPLTNNVGDENNEEN
jgi:hypothetical protein